VRSGLCEQQGKAGRELVRRVGVSRLVAGVAACLVACGGGAPPQGRVVTVTREDLVLDVEVTGTLKSLESVQVGPPASVADAWEFKITRMIPEGTRVKIGQEVIAFDPSTLEQKLKDYEAEVAQSTEELGKRQSERSLAVLADKLDLVDAEAKQRKAELKAEKPPDLTAQVTLKTAEIDRDLARREVEFRETRTTAKRQQEKADMAILTGRLTRARGRVAEIKAAIAAMAVKAMREGTVVYKQDFRGEKKKPGDGMWRFESVLEIASLERMAAVGQVDEVDASKIAVGQRVGLRLEAHPDKEYDGTVERVANLVQTESPESRVKIVTLDIKLNETDPLLMRPAMRFRGRIEIARVPNVLQVPLAAIISTPAGPTVARLDGNRATPVTLGRRGREAVEVTAGLAPGDKVLLKSAASATAPSSGFRLGSS
jgi:HlyD family secretion protein